VRLSRCSPSAQIIFVDRAIRLVVCHALCLLAPFMARAQSQAEIHDALSSREYRKADAALNAAYARDMAGKNPHIPPSASTKALKKAQLAWLKFRDADAIFYASSYDHNHPHTRGSWLEEYASTLDALTYLRTEQLEEGTYKDVDSDRYHDTSLNDAYKKLLSILDDRQKKLLTTAELAWIKFRDAEIGRFAGTKPKYAVYARNKFTIDRTKNLYMECKALKPLSPKN
jgi:uncharacterized protein YecT (DUF1311 family)